MNHANSAELQLWQGKREAGWWICSLAHAPLCNSFLIWRGKTEARPFTTILLGVYHEIYLNGFVPLPMLCTPQKFKGQSLIFPHVLVSSCSMLFFITVFLIGVNESFTAYKPDKVVQVLGRDWGVLPQFLAPVTTCGIEQTDQ